MDASYPEHEHICTCCRTVIFLQGSTLYDVVAIREKLKLWEEVLGFEVAILDGKVYILEYPPVSLICQCSLQLGNHNEAL